MKQLAWIILCFLFFQHLSAQQFGGFPPSTKWRQINTDTARIIFTPGAEWQAQRIATLINKAAADTPFALGSVLKKINVVLHSQTTLANGYVALAPFRSEFYLVPGSNVFDFGNLPWYENLALHEYHHVQQYNNFRNGLSNGFYYLFGEQGLALANALAIPDWFFEGDAVHTETALTTQGRGRLSNFLSGYNSLWLERKNYSWLKLRNGSLKDYVPDHYQLGYLLVNYGYMKYGNQFWKNVTHDASAFKGLFYPFQKAIKEYSGVDYKIFRNDALDFYKQKLGNPQEEHVEKNKTVTNYYFPQYISAGSMLYLKSAYNKLPAFYIKDKNGEHKIALQSISSEQWFSYRNGIIAYTAYSPNPRWSLIDYSDIVLLDINNHTEKRITRKAKYFTPDISADGDKIVAIKINDSLQTELQIINSDDGKIIQTINPGNDLYFTNPRFVDDHRIVVGTRKPDSKMALQIVDLATNKWEELTPFSYHTIGFPFVFNNTIYFTANFNANDDVYAVKLKDKKILQLTSGFTGNYYPSVFGNTLVWSRFTAEGLSVRKKPLDKSGLGEINALSIQEQPLLYPVALEHDITSTFTRRFAVKRYRKGTGLFHFHSWSPNYNDPEFTFTLFSDNILNSFSNQFYYRYNRNETSHTFGYNTSYGGFYPVLNAGVEYTYNRTINTPTNVFTYNQVEARLGYNIPLNFTKGKMYKTLNFGTNYVFNHSMPTGLYKDSLNAASAAYLEHFITWANYLPMAVQHIYPKFGYTLAVYPSHLLNRKGYQVLSTAQVFLPSFANHSIVLRGSWQETDTSNTVFANRFAYSRGYTAYYFSRMWKFSANYHFPIAYPDLGLAGIIYLQRLRGNLFYDFTKVYSKNKLNTRGLRSVGAELFFDTKWWNQLPVSFGIRVSHLLDNGFNGLDKKGSNWFEFILPVNLIPSH